MIALGGLGCFDEHGIFPMNVVRDGDAIFGYTSGWSRRVSVSVETAIGLAISHDDGVTFERVGRRAGARRIPARAVPGRRRVRPADRGGTYHMWYIFGTGWRRYDA